MRFEQLVLYLPGDQFRLRFSPRVTVVSGVDEAARADLLDAVIKATAGLTPNATVIFTDHTGRRIFAESTGATYADTSEPAPTPAQLIGGDPDVLLQLMALRAADLGLEGGRPLAQLRGDLVGARSAVSDLRAELDQAVERAFDFDERQDDLAEVAAQLARLEDDEARWRWLEASEQADDLRAELAALDRDPDGKDDADCRLLDAVAEVRESGEAWADLATAAEQLRDQLGAPPAVSRADVARVAATPDAVPTMFTERFNRWQQATADRRAAELAADEVEHADPAVPDDALVEALARVDQDALWATHAELVGCSTAFEEASTRFGGLNDEIDPAVEHDVEAAHLDVVRSQRRVKERSLPGALAAGALAASTLLSIRLGIVAGAATLLSALAVACWLVLVPRRRLSDAVREETAQLRRAGAATWLGLHLRRIDGPIDAKARRELEEAANAKAAAEVDWQDLVGEVDVVVAGAREAEIRAHAAEIDPAARAARIAECHRAVETARRREHAAAGALTSGLGAYGIPENIPTDQVRSVLAGRIAAGRVARDWGELFRLDDALQLATTDLDRLLGDLGFHGDDLEERLTRVIGAVARARTRLSAAEHQRDRGELEAELRVLAERIEHDRRPGWAGSPDPTERPADEATLEDRRRTLADTLAAEPRPDVTGAQRRYDLMVSRVADLERQLGEGPDGTAPLHKRLIARVARTTWQGGVEESVPILLDDPLTQVPVDQRCDLLDMLVRLSDKTQIVYLTGDPVVARWARQRATEGAVSLFEPEPATVP
ncbi:MAG: hypothetical protein JWN46_1454 [Acidimicrobiales bacterium]|nr:hypothetical protein [Acidimicrobiales bacterium]